MELKIGVLLPRSDMFPTLAIDFLNGIKLPFKLLDEQNYNPKFIIESIGNATDSNLLQRIEQMMLQEEVDIIISFCSYFMLDNLVTIANSFKKPIIHVSLGARVLKPTHCSPYVLHESLNLCHTSYLSGKYAVEKFGKKVAMLSSFYDGGYHMSEALYNGIFDHGGEIVYNYVSPLDYKTETFQTLIEGIENSKPDVLVSLFSYKEANKVIEKLTESGLDAIPNIAVPLMTDESIEISNSLPKNIYSIASEDETESMKNFCSNYIKQYEEKPTIISLLGEEIGNILLNTVQNEGKIPNKIGDYLQPKIVTSTRGNLRFTECNESIPDSFKVRILEKQNGFFQNTVIEALDSSTSEIINKKMENLPNTGWKNPYICT
jgi:branched-chain amino acid transport system substrate-binding protein